MAARHPDELDRVIQQAMLRSCNPAATRPSRIHSYGLRPGRRAHADGEAAKRWCRKAVAW